MNWVNKTAIEQCTALQHGEISASELLEITLAHSETLIPHINPFGLKLYDRARLMAKEADRLLRKSKGGPLCGLPITIKDSNWLAGVTCANGSRTLENFIPNQTSSAVQRLEDAGAVIFAKTTCPEFCVNGITESELYGRTSNPWNTSKTPGGSSGGAAAAVAAGMGSLSLGGDGGGSIRIPAAFCGITGFKPSFGNIPRGPGFKTWESIIAYGPMARTVSDTKLMYSVLTDTCSGIDGHATFLNKSHKLIASDTLGFAPVDDDVLSAFHDVLHLIENAGHPLVHDNPGLHSSVVTWAVTATYDMWEHKQSLIHQNEEVGSTARAFIEFGGEFTETDFADAQEHRVKVHDSYIDMFKRNRSAILLTPTLGCEAFDHGTIHPPKIGDTEITYPWLDWAGFLYDGNLAGLPACSIPMGIGDEGLPLSLQIIGAPGNDAEVLEVALMIEDLIQWQTPVFSADHYSTINSQQPTTPRHHTHVAGHYDIHPPTDQTGF